MSLVEFAKMELSMIPNDEDGMQEEMNKGILDIVEVFSKQGHSGMSAGYAVGIIEKLLRFEPLGPLTGEDAEWCTLDYDDNMKAQNKRCSHVFKRADGTAYDIEAVIFQEPDGCCFTSSDSHRDITFPYTPSREYVQVSADR